MSSLHKSLTLNRKRQIGLGGQLIILKPATNVTFVSGLILTTSCPLRRKCAPMSHQAAN